MIGIKGSTCEIIASVVITWAPKICMVINALAMGLCASIIPYIVEGYVKKDNKLMNSKFNQSINTIFLVSIPVSMFIILFKNQIYYLFYGVSEYGGIILALNSVVSIFFSITLVLNMVLQGMKRYELVYFSTISGLIVNTLLDIPLILFLNSINFYPYLGTLFATLIGQIVSMIIPLYVLRKEHEFKYRDILRTLKRIILPLLTMLLVILLFRTIIVFNNGYLITFVKVGIIGLFSVGTYILVAYKNNLLNNVLGEETINRLLKKIGIKGR